MTTTAEYIAAIRKALDAGPTPGEWNITENTGEDEAYCDWHDVGPFSLMGGEANENSRFVSYCNPVAMTAVLAELDRLKAENERMREALEFYDCHGPVLCDCNEGQEDKDNVCCGFRARAALKGDTHGN